MIDLDEKLGAAANPRKVKEQETRAKLHKDREVQDMLAVLSTRPGRRFVRTVLEMTHWNKISFVDRNHDLTILNEGERNIGLQVMTLLREADPNAEVLMQQEAKEDQNYG